MRIRSVWVVTPLRSVGPLWFGMTIREAAAALREAHELRRFQADPYDPRIVGIEVGFRRAEPALYEYFDEAGRLFCVAADAVRGPRMTLDGTELAGADLVELEQWLVDLPGSVGGLRYGPRGSPGIDDLGLVVRVQDTADGLRTRPVLVGQAWADCCVDDHESRIPECELTGPVWPHRWLSQEERVWLPVGYAPAWVGR